MEEGTFASWIKKEGEKVSVGDPLFVLEGEKSLQEIESLDSGTLRILPESPKTGDTVKVGQLIGHLLNPAEPLPKVAPAPVAASDAIPVSPVPEDQKPSSPWAKSALETVRDIKVFPEVPRSAEMAPLTSPSTPRARRTATELQVNLTEVIGTGKGGRIREIDVRKASPGEALATVGRLSVSSAPSSVPITALRRTIADRMVASLTNTAPVTLNSIADVTKLVALRNELKSAAKGTLVPSYNDLLVKLTGCAIGRFPLIAGKWQHDHIELPASINIGIAVDTEHGLLVPVIRDVPKLSLLELSSTSRTLINAAKSRKIRPDDLQGGVFTVTNLGSFGIDGFSPIINFPEIAILGVGAIRRTPAILEDGTIGIRDQVALSLTFDHRVIDGAPAARFLQALIKSVENPIAWLLGYVPLDDGSYETPINK